MTKTDHNHRRPTPTPPQPHPRQAHGYRDTQQTAAPEAPPAGTQRRWRRCVIGLLVLITAAGTLFTVATVAAAHTTAQQDRDAVVLSTARQTVDNLLTIDPNNGQAAFDRMVSTATGSWRDQLERQATDFTRSIQDAHVLSRGSSATAALERADDQSAVVLVPANATVANRDAPTGGPRQYRLALTLEHHGDRWLVSSLEFVP